MDGHFWVMEERGTQSAGTRAGSKMARLGIEDLTILRGHSLV